MSKFSSTLTTFVKDSVLLWGFCFAISQNCTDVLGPFNKRGMDKNKIIVQYSMYSIGHIWGRLTLCRCTKKIIYCPILYNLLHLILFTHQLTCIHLISLCKTCNYFIYYLYFPLVCGNHISTSTLTCACYDRFLSNNTIQKLFLLELR